MIMLRKYPIFYYLALLPLIAFPLILAGKHALILLWLDRGPGVEEAIAAIEEENTRINERTGQRGIPADNTMRKILAVSEDLPDGDDALVDAERDLRPAARKHAETLHEVLTFFRAHAELDRGAVDWVPPFPASHPLAEPLKQRYDLTGKERALSDLYRGLPKTADLLSEKLIEYGKQPGHSVRFLREMEANVQQQDLLADTKLAALGERVRKSLQTREEDPARVRSDVEKVIQRLEQFSARFAVQKEKLAWADKERGQASK